MRTIVYSFLKRLPFCFVLFASCHEDERTGDENFYRIAGEYYHLINKSEMDKYVNDPTTGCIYAISSEEERIPVSDNPKVKPVLIISKTPDTPEMPDWDWQDSTIGQER
ncbi:hypothetical protein [Parapedobacter koreensis]|uniref:Uncharacterized protein n=1 Tax=Parapedobacter koreensis TaxID=332977 RepID=A0A1H7FEQ0_9SPHI|nr:hypothetical protein [Parapedobacter koreensis]SEK24449.1 hypothetical protein SAMN05421740_101325 [Parapedobacter koreensis]